MQAKQAREQRANPVFPNVNDDNQQEEEPRAVVLIFDNSIPKTNSYHYYGNSFQRFLKDDTTYLGTCTQE